MNIMKSELLIVLTIALYANCQSFDAEEETYSEKKVRDKRGKF